jgi:muramoyltetrapeptide carboxypeptidase
MITVPAYLRKGDTIGIVCPSGYMPAERAATCIHALENWGYQVRIGKTLGHQFHYFSGTDEERAADLQAMLDDPEIKAVLCARGGYGLSRIIDRIDFRRFRKNPKWLIGFSDITVLHAHLYTKLKTASLHAPMAGAFNDVPDNDPYILSLQKAIKGGMTQYAVAAHSLNRNGKAIGELVGGNLSLLAHLVGSPSSIQTKGKILFIEDVGEYIYNIDRMMIQLKRAGLLSGLAGLIVGGFTEMKDTVIPFGKDVYTLIHEQIADTSYPVCFDFPVSHDRNNYALKVGIQHQLTVTTGKVSLREIRS